LKKVLLNGMTKKDVSNERIIPDLCARVVSS